MKVAESLKIIKYAEFRRTSLRRPVISSGLLQTLDDGDDEKQARHNNAAISVLDISYLAMQIIVKW